MRNTYLLASVSLVAMACGSRAAAQAGAGAASADQVGTVRPFQLEEVVVTASRRSATIRETPTAVSAYGEERLKDAHIASLTDLVALSPNVQISTFTTSVNIAIRGIGTGNLTNAGADAGVAVHFDGVYLAQAGLAASTFLDIARVEVLRGPQGTLFGRNATGGAINIIPNLPTRTLAYGADVTAGVDPTLVRSSAYVSGPLTSSGDLSGRFSAQQNYNRGFTRNLAVDGPRRLDGVNNYAARGQLQWQLTPDFSARLLVEYQKEEDNGPAAFLLGTPDPTQPLPVQIQGFPTGDVRHRKTYANVGKKDLEAKTIILTTDWAVGGGHLKGLISYNQTDQFFDQDGDGTAAPFTSTSFRDAAHQTYGEILYASDDSRTLSYVLGANLFDEGFRQDISVPIQGFPVPVNLGGFVKTKSYAVFGHAQYRITDTLKVFGGLRYSSDDKSISEYNNFVGTKSQQRSWARVTYEGGISYDFSKAVTGYAKYATGYKSGGFSAGSLAPPFNPETNSNIEVGLKGSYLQGALQANLAAFHMKYDNLQVNQVIGVSSQVTNAAKATIDGVEIETVLQPIERFRVEASGAWLDARFDKFDTQDSSRPTLGLLHLAGNQLPGAPHFNASVGAFYDLPVSKGTVTLGARYDWKSKLYFSEFNIPIASQNAVGKLDLSLRYKSEDRRWTASAFVLNATDENVKSNVIVVSALLGSLALGQYQPGRQFGVSLGYHF